MAISTYSANVQSSTSAVISHNAEAFQPDFELPSASPYQSVEAYGPLMDLVFSVRYASYSAENYIEPNSSRRFMDEFDDKSSCKSFLMYYHNKLIGSIRACVYYPDRPGIIPAMEIFKEELEREVGLDKTMVEANKFVVHPDFQRKGGVKARLNMYRNIVECAFREKAQCIVVAVRPAHVNFYRMFHFHPISDAKLYPKLKFETVLMACPDVQACKDFIWSKTGG